MQNQRVLRRAASVAAVALCLSYSYGTGIASASEIVVAGYGSSPNGMPFAVALAEGFFKEAGVNIDGIRTSSGGGNDVRNLMAGDLDFADGAITAVIAANQAGADLRIVSDDTRNASGGWVANANSTVTMQDLKGKRVGYTQPQSATQALLYWLLKKHGYAPGEVTTVSTGGYGPGLTLLANGGLDATTLNEPAFSIDQGKYHVLISGRDPMIPAYNSTVGFVSLKAAESRPNVIRGILAARRKAVKFMTTNRDKAAEDIAAVYKMPKADVVSFLGRVIDGGSKDSVAYFGEGDFNEAALNVAIEMGRAADAVKGDFDLKTMVDPEFLPDDLKPKK